jgi:sRNA-binding regulator protein Hfq
VRWAGRGSKPAGKDWATQAEKGKGEKVGRGKKKRNRARLKAGKGERERLGVLFFSNLFKLKHFQNSFQNFQIILKLLKLHTNTFKHQANKTSCTSTCCL